MVDLAADPIGTSHARAACCWCRALLVVAQIEQLRCWLCPNCWARQEVHALYVRGQKKDRRCVYVPLPSQVRLYEAPERYVLWGGQAGPGKSRGVRFWLYTRALMMPGYEALLLRENWDQLRDNHTLKMAHEVPSLGGRWLEGDRLAIFGKGSDQSIIHCGHMAETNALTRYVGIEYVDIAPDEAARYPVTMDGVSPLGELSTRARLWGTDRQGRKVAPKWVPVTNPGGPSAQWLADMHIHKTPDFEKYPALRKDYRPEEWTYLPATLDDNPYLGEDYERSLAVLEGVRYEQLRHGDWDVFSGQFFSEWSKRLHVRECVVA